MRKSEAERLLELESKRFLETKIDERLKKLLENPDAVTKLEVCCIYPEKKVSRFGIVGG